VLILIGKFRYEIQITIWICIYFLLSNNTDHNRQWHVCHFSKSRSMSVSLFLIRSDSQFVCQMISKQNSWYEFVDHIHFL
jgi:hypothetical protein